LTFTHRLSSGIYRLPSFIISFLVAALLRLGSLLCLLLLLILRSLGGFLVLATVITVVAVIAVVAMLATIVLAVAVPALVLLSFPLLFFLNLFFGLESLVLADILFPAFFLVLEHVLE